MTLVREMYLYFSESFYGVICIVFIYYLLLNTIQSLRTNTNLFNYNMPLIHEVSVWFGPTVLVTEPGMLPVCWRSKTE